MVKQKQLKSQKGNEISINFKDINTAVNILKSLNHPIRQKIITYLFQNPGSSVNTLYTKLKLEQSFTSSHLALLRKAGVVKTERAGQSILYSINQSKIDELEMYAKSIVKLASSKSK